MANDSNHAWQSYQSFLEAVPARQADLDFFSTIPCARPYLSASAYKPIPSYSRQTKRDDTSETLLSNTINSPDTIHHLLLLAKHREKSAQRDWIARLDNNDSIETETETATKGGETEPDLVTLVHLGSGLNGFRDTLHGGILATLLDEALGLCVEGCRAVAADLEGEGEGQRTELLTAELTMSYRAPVSTPGVLVIETWVKRRRGRKWFLEGRVVGEDGKVRTEARGLWISARTGARL